MSMRWQTARASALILGAALALVSIVSTVCAGGAQLARAPPHLHHENNLVYKTSLRSFQPGQCFYLATLSLFASDFELSGSIEVYSDVGDQVTTFESLPFGITIDSINGYLYVSTPSTIQEYDIMSNLQIGEESCPCAYSLGSGNSMIKTLAVDLTHEVLYFALGTQICGRALDRSWSKCTSFNLTDTIKEIYIVNPSVRKRQDSSATELRLFATSSSKARVWAFSIDNGEVTRSNNWGSVSPSPPPRLRASALSVEPSPSPGPNVFTGISGGPTENIFVALPVTPQQPCALSELSIIDGTPVACMELTNDTRILTNMRELHWSTNLYRFFTLIRSNESNSNASSDNFDIVSFGLEEASPGRYVPFDVHVTVTEISSALSFVLGSCPVDPTPSPSASPAVLIRPSSSDSTTIIAASVAAGSGGLFLLLVLMSLFIWFVLNKRRRKYYDSKDDDAENGMGMEVQKFSFREIDARDLRLGKVLGEGAFGKVFKGEYRGAVVAVKMFDALKLNQADEKMLNELRSEAQMMERLSNHPNIVKFVGAITKGDDGTNFALVTEFCPRGSLYDLLVKKKKLLPLVTLVRMARDAASGILHLHKEHIAHRDIAARNILVGQNYEVYVSDFGLARAAIEGQAATTKQNFGPIAWMAPEALKMREYSEATDAFSFGVLLWEMVTKKRPWAGMDPVQIITSVTNNTRLKIPKDCDPVLAQLMKQCWRNNASQRPTFEKITEVLTKYHKTLIKIHGSEGGDVSDNSADDMELAEGIDYGEWQASRVKKEIVGFMKQLISERNDEYKILEKSFKEAYEEVTEALLKEVGHDHSVSEEASDDDEATNTNQHIAYDDLDSAIDGVKVDGGKPSFPMSFAELAQRRRDEVKKPSGFPTISTDGQQSNSSIAFTYSGFSASPMVTDSTDPPFSNYADFSNQSMPSAGSIPTPRPSKGDDANDMSSSYAEI